MKFTRLILILAGVWGLSACESPTTSGKSTTTKYSEGSVSAPITLTVETPRACQVGKGSSDQNSYYKFTVPADGDYYIKGSGFSPSSVTGFSPNVYLASDFSPPASYTSAGNYTTSLKCTGLTTGTTYYLKVMNMYDTDTNVNFTMIISATGP